MRRSVVISSLLAFAAPAAFLAPVQAASTGNPAPQTGRVVSADPAGFTPHVMSGAVYTMAQVGSWIVVGGSFTTVRNAGSNTDIPRANVFAFDATTGQVSTTFAPNPNGAVYKVLDAGNGQVFLGGAFTSASGGAVSRLYKAEVSNGARVTQFAPGTLNGTVRDLNLTGNRLWIAGAFAQIQGQAQRGLGTLNATTGVRDDYFRMTIAGTHQPNSTNNVRQIATNPANNQLVAIGNFATVNGTNRHQFAVFDIGGPTVALANYYTTLFESPCSTAFDTYMTDVEYAPNGSFFVIVTTGAYGGATASNAGTSGCDVAARFESNASGLNVRPTWTTYTGGDTTHSVEITDNVVYVGGHQRWQNNPGARDAAGPGAVARPGIAALSAVNGLPYTWNPTRARGVGVKDMIATEQGLFAGSDTDTFGGETHRRVAFVPLSGGVTLPTIEPHTLPGTVYGVASGQSQLTARTFDGSTAGASQNVGVGGWGTAVGAFMVDGNVYTGFTNGDITRRTFDGTTFGPSILVDTADEIVRQTAWHADVPGITSFFYDNGRIYYTRSGQSVLYWRGFETESDVVSQHRLQTNAIAGVSYTNMRGAFVANGRLYFASSTGTLSSVAWNGAGPNPGPSGPVELISSAGGGWSSRVLFLFQGP